MTSCERTHLPWKNLHSHNLLMKTHQNSKYEPVNPNGVRLMSKKLSKTNYWLYYTGTHGIHMTSCERTYLLWKKFTFPTIYWWKHIRIQNMNPVNPNGVRLMSKKLSKTNYWLYYTVHIGFTCRHVKEHTSPEKNLHSHNLLMKIHQNSKYETRWTQTVCV